MFGMEGNQCFGQLALGIGAGYQPVGQLFQLPWGQEERLAPLGVAQPEVKHGALSPCRRELAHGFRKQQRVDGIVGVAPQVEAECARCFGSFAGDEQRFAEVGVLAEVPAFGVVAHNQILQRVVLPQQFTRGLPLHARQQRFG